MNQNFKKKNKPKKYIRTIDELIFAKVMLEQQSVTTKPLTLSGILQRIKETRNVEITKGFRTMAYRFLARLLACRLIEPYCYVHEDDWKTYQFKIFWVKPEGAQQLDDEFRNISKL